MNACNLEETFQISALDYHQCNTVKPVLSDHSRRRPKLFFKSDHRWMQIKSIAECSNGSILQYFWPSLSYHLPLRHLFCLFLSGRLRPVLLYMTMYQKGWYPGVDFCSTTGLQIQVQLPYLSTKTYVVGTQKNCLYEAVFWAPKTHVLIDE